MTQTSWDISGRRIFIPNEGQAIPQNANDWNHFLDNGENKTKLINFLLRYVSTQKVRSRFKVKLLFTESTNTREITPSGINMLFTSSHHKADTRIALHTSRSIKSVIMTADNLVLLTHSYPQVTMKSNGQWKLIQEYLLILKQFVTSLKTVFVKFYQDSIVLLVVIQPSTNFMLEKLALLRKCVISAKCFCYINTWYS